MNRAADHPRAEIEALQKRIRTLRSELEAARRAVPPEPVTDYVLRDGGGEVRLSELFGDRQDLVVVHNMGSRCPMCTTWADGFDGLRRHLEDRVAFVVSSPDPPEKQREFAAGRGWSLRMVSTAGTTFAADLGMAGENDGQPWLAPGISVFRRSGDGIVRVTWDWFGPGDEYCSLWSVLELLPDGQNDWWPKLSYT